MRKKVLITGGAGSLGSALVRHWRDEYDLTIFSRDPHKQQKLQAETGLDFRHFVLGDVTDYESIKRACIGQDVLIHAAALKVVSQGEQHPLEYYRVNSVGSLTVAQAWNDTHHRLNADYRPVRQPRKALYINSDKAVSPINAYGVSKRIGELAFLHYGFSSLRYGNVVESQGSFIHFWQKALNDGKPLSVRFPHPTRFFLSIKGAINLIEDVLLQESNGVFVPYNLAAFDIREVALAMTATEAGLCHSSLQPGEKQHEVLLHEGECPVTVSDRLALVRNLRKSFESEFYSSEKTPLRLSGQEVLTRLGIAVNQEVFA